MRRFVSLITACFVLAVPGLALADGGGALLSGYGGPGSGEQSVLGTTLLPAHHSGGGTGGLQATPQAATATPVAAAPVTPVTHPSKPAHHHGAAVTTPQTKTAPAVTTGPASTRTPPVPLPDVRYPAVQTAAGTTVGGVPAGDLWPLVLGLLGLVVVGIVTRRAVGPDPAAPAA